MTVKRGLANVPKKIRTAIARKGGLAKHRIRGMQCLSVERRRAIARQGGIARHAAK